MHKTLEALPKTDIKRLTDAMVRLADDPHPPQSKKLTNDDRYLNLAFDTSRTPDGRTAPPLKYLTPTREVVPGE